MKNTIIIIVVLAIASYFQLHAQMHVDRLDGGVLDSRFRMEGNPLFFNKYTVPEGEYGITVACTAPWSLDINNYYDVEKKMNDRIDWFARKYGDAATSISHARATVAFEHVLRLKALSLWKKTETIECALFWRESFFTEADGQYSGFRAVMSDTDGTSTARILLGGVFDFFITGQRHEYGVFARYKTTRESFSMQLQKTYYRFEGNVQFRPRSILVFNGVEYFFNDPTDPKINFDAGETNKLDQAFAGAYEGDAFEMNIRYDKHLSRSVTIGIDTTYTHDLLLSGSMDGAAYVFKAVRFNYDENEFNIDEIDPAKPTKTQKTDITVTEPITIKYPEQIGFHVSYRFSKFAYIELMPSLYLGEYTYRIKTNKKEIYDGYEAKWGAEINMQLWPVLIHAKVIAGETLYQNKPFYLPDLSLKLTIPIKNYVTVNLCLYSSFINTNDIECAVPLK